MGLEAELCTQGLVGSAAGSRRRKLSSLGDVYGLAQRVSPSIISTAKMPFVLRETIMGTQKTARSMKITTMRNALLWLGCVLAVGVSVCATKQDPRSPTNRTTKLFPFVLPWDDAAPSVANLSHWLHKPAGKFGPIHAAADGHLYAGDQRIRFFGVNLCFGANFPPKEDAEKIAARLAKFGINLVRLHHLDMMRFPEGILKRQVANTRELDPEALDRLDYLVAQLRRQGIYVNVNLLVDRTFSAHDGLPKEIEQVDKQVRRVLGCFYEPCLALEKEYARKLLAHRNTYTGLSYAEDPAVAFVEINNENGLLHAWLSGALDRLPEVFLRELQSRWNGWLKRRYGSSERLRLTWNMREPLGQEMLVNTDFRAGLQHWILERHGDAEAHAELVRDPDKGWVLRIHVTKPGRESWHVLLHQRNLKVQGDRPYTVTFWAKASQPCAVSVSLTQAHEPWQHLAFCGDVQLTQEWREFRICVVPVMGDENVRLMFSDLSRQATTYWLAAPSLRPGGDLELPGNQRLEDGTVPTVLRSRFCLHHQLAQRDWLRFLGETEEHYWQSMYRYLKEELKVQALVMGTIVGCSTPNLMAALDCVDTHAYWQHPIFFTPPPGAWEKHDDWAVPNRSMVSEPGGILSDIALRRVRGKPHSVTEYSHPAPNTYSSEGYLLLAAYAALQDWDAVYAYSYAHWNMRDLRYIGNFFDIAQHPTKMVTLIPAVAMFVRGDVRPANSEVVVSLTKDREIELLRRSEPWVLVHAGHLGVPRQAALVHRVAIATGNTSRPPSALRPEQLTLPRDRVVSDTGELIWDLTERGQGWHQRRGVVTVNSTRSKAVIGFAADKVYDLGGVVIRPADTIQDGWCAISVTVMEGSLPSSIAKPRRGPTRLLITATGYVENTGIGWKDLAGYPPKSSCGRDWGRPPTLVEGISAVITLPLPARGVQAWALDERGQRKTELHVTSDAGGQAVLTLGPQWQTLWYEVLAP